jgi:hypothetical protein
MYVEVKIYTLLALEEDCDETLQCYTTLHFLFYIFGLVVLIGMAHSSVLHSTFFHLYFFIGSD